MRKEKKPSSQLLKSSANLWRSLIRFSRTLLSLLLLCVLGKSLEALAGADIIYFCPGWDTARGCKIEHQCAVEYGIERIYE